MDNAGSDGGFFLNIVGFCSITEAKSREVRTVYWRRGLFSKTKRHLQNDAVWFSNCQSGKVSGYTWHRRGAVIPEWHSAFSHD